MSAALPNKQAFIGVGTMGSLMAGCLLDTGVDLAVYDIRRDAAEPLVQRGARWADGAEAAVAGCEIVWTSLPGPTQVESVLLGDEAGVLSAMAAGATLVDTTTNDPDVARRVSTACSERGLSMLDAPVSGRPPTMTMMIGGERDVFERVRDSLDAVAAQVFYVGPAGAGCVAKLATQYMGYTNLIAAIEGMLIARRGGVDPAVLAEIVPVSAGASRAFNAIPNSILDRSFAAGGTLDIVAKDVALACALAERLEAPAGTGSVADALYKQAQAQGWGDEGYPIVARILEATAGVELRPA
ncbi:MAG: NAD(P)-dependent oxidoreductase [Chloroflexota bacterium]|nr:NAD(P)-dependent oxidoreductase [Chloroflexota bacterium]MDE2961874.1 NAD(P)-dependent oxidoreductase [Chloroflexota bacterium]